jgi:hypothetical protein
MLIKITELKIIVLNTKEKFWSTNNKTNKKQMIITAMKLYPKYLWLTWKSSICLFLSKLSNLISFPPNCLNCAPQLFQ